MAKSKSEKRGVYLYIDGQEIINNVNHIEKECRQLTQQLNSMTLGSEEYNRQMQKIQHLKGILREHRNEIRGVTEDTKKSTISVGKLVDGFNRFGGIIVTVIGFLTGVTLALRSFRDERNKLEESQAGLKALTGLDDDSIAWLTRQAKLLSTTMTEEGLRVRQSASEILDAYMLVGSAKPELLGYKEALAAVTEEAMRLQAAAKDIKLSEAVDALTLSLNQYGAAADQAGRFANVLAAGSKEGAANIASQARTIRNAGVAAASANVSIEQTVGLIETLAEKGIKDEVAGTGLKKFFLVLQTGADDINPKIVGLNQALDNLAAKNLGAKAIKDMFGEEGYNVASVIMQDIDKVKQYTAAVTGTNIAYEQAATNSSTAAAALDQARNKMKLAAIELGEKLNPAFAVSTNLATNLIKLLPGLIDWLKKWGSTITLLLAPVATYNAYLKAATLFQLALNNVTKVAATFKVIYSAVVANLSGNLTGCNKILNLFTSSMIKNKAVVQIVTSATYLFAAAKAVLTGNIKKARLAMTAFNASCTKNVYIAIATAIMGIAAAVYKLATRTSEAEKAINKYQEKLITEREQLRKLTEAAMRAGEGTKQRKELIDEINGKYGQYLTNLLNEHSSLKDIKIAYQEINEAMKVNIAQKVLDEKTEEINRDMLEDKIENMNNIRKILLGLLPEGQVNKLSQRINELTQKYIEEGKNAAEVAATLDYGLKNTFLKGTYVPGELRKSIRSYADTVIEETKRVKKVKDSLSSFVPGLGSNNEIPEVVITGKAPKKNGTEDTSKFADTDPDKFAAAEAAYYRRIAAIKKQYLDDDRMTQAEYNRQMQDAELSLLNDKLRVAGLEPKERQQIADKILDTEIKLRDDLRKQEEKEAEENSKQTSTRLQKQYQLAVESATLQHYQLRTSEEDFYAELRRLQDEYFRQMLDDTAVGEEEKNKIREEMRKRDLDDAKEQMEKETKERRKQYEEQQRMADRYVDIVSAAGQDLGDALGDLLTAQDDAMKNLWKQLLLTAVDAIEQYIRLTYIKALADSIIGLNFVKALGALAKIAAIETAFAAVKGAIGNFYTGGFTPSGDWNQPQGVVHSNEFVANRYAVANPALRPIFDVIDVAQRSGNVSNLTADDVAAVARGGRVTAPAPTAAPTRSGSPTAANDPALAALLAECNRTLRRLKQRLDEPITAETYLTGKGGINEAQKEYTKIQNNKSRHRTHD